MLVFRLHALAGLMPEPVRQYCTNVYCMVYTQADTTDPITLLRGLYPTALPEELVGVAPELAGRQLSPEALKGALVYKVIQQAFTGQELRHRKWCEVSSRVFFVMHWLAFQGMQSWCVLVCHQVCGTAAQWLLHKRVVLVFAALRLQMSGLAVSHHSVVCKCLHHTQHRRSGGTAYIYTYV